MADKKQGTKVGEVTHYFPKAGAAVVKFLAPVSKGTEIVIKGSRGEKKEPFEFEMTVESLQKDHTPVDSAKKGDDLGMAVAEPVKEGDEVYLAE